MTAHTHTLVVIACGAAKAPQALPAGQLYTSATWAHFAAAAQAVARSDSAYFGHRTEVVVLSARHGLVDLQTVIAPYDDTFTRASSVTVTKCELIDQLVHRAPAVIMSLLPGAYWSRLRDAVATVNEEGCESDPWIELLDCYEPGFGAAFGIGYQRGCASRLLALEGS
jgi:hypothetical protein